MAYNRKSLDNLNKGPAGNNHNPNGRPIGSVSAKTIINKWLQTKGKKPKNLPKTLSDAWDQLSQLDIITLAQLEKARKGDTPAYNALLDRTEGKPKQTQEHEFPIDPETEITVSIIRKGKKKSDAEDSD